MSVSLSVAVIGAGAAGLTSIRELQREGHSVTALEQSSNLGGVWKYSESVEDDLLGRNPDRHRVHSSLYESVRTNIPRQIMGFSDFPLISEAMRERSVDSRPYPRHEEVLAFLEAFADEFELRSAVQFSTRVLEVAPVPQDQSGGDKGLEDASRWRVTTVSTASTSNQVPVTRVYDAVVSAVGNYHEPNLPDVPGMIGFPGQQLHCHNYRSNASFAGKIVLVVGASFSGDEIARKVAEVAETVYVTARTWTNPNNPQPRANMRKLPWLQRLHSDGSATFQGGHSVRLDCIIYSTGYKYTYPWLQKTGLLSTDNMHVSPLYKAVFHIDRPTLSFVGLPWKSVRFPQFEVQAKLVARVLSGRTKLPSRESMSADNTQLCRRYQEKGVPMRYFFNQSDAMPVNQWDYNDELARMCGPDVPASAPWRRELTSLILPRAVFARPDTFRDASTEEEQLALERANKACQQILARHLSRRQQIISLL